MKRILLFLILLTVCVPSATFAAPADARAPEDISSDELRPTLFTPLLKMLERVQKQQDAALERLELIAAGQGEDRADEILKAVDALKERKVTISGWKENQDALLSLREGLEKFRDRLERVATTEDVAEAVGAIQSLAPKPVEIDLSGVAREETLLAFEGRFPTLENVREISENVASLTARLDEIAARVEEIDLNGEVVSLKKQLQIVILVAAIILAVIVFQCAVFLIRWVVSLTKASKARAKDAWNAAIFKAIQDYEQNKSVESTAT